MKKIYFISLALFLLSIPSYAQRTCGSELNLSAIQQNNPERYSRILEIEKQTQHFIQQRKAFSPLSHGGLSSNQMHHYSVQATNSIIAPSFYPLELLH